MSIRRTITALTLACLMALTGCGLSGEDAQQAFVRGQGVSWRYPAQRLDQGNRPACGYYAALQQLNMRGARITQAQADHMWPEVARQAPSAARPFEAIVRDVLAAHGIRVTWRPVKSRDVLMEVYRGPLTVNVRYLTGMDDTSPDGHWRAVGGYSGYDHAVTMTGYDPRAKRVLLLNQWGREWGRDGGMWLTVDEWRRLAASTTVWTLS